MPTSVHVVFKQVVANFPYPEYTDPRKKDSAAKLAVVIICHLFTPTGYNL